MKEKKITCFLIYNWKEDSLRMRKTNSTVGPYEISTKVVLKFKVPKVPLEKVSKEVELPQGKVKEIFAEFVEEEEEENDKPYDEVFITEEE